MAKRKPADDTAHDWKPAPYRPHWHADFWGHSRVLNMTLEVVGLFLRLLDMHWVNGARGIPARRDRLLRVLPAVSEAFPKFPIIEHHPRTQSIRAGDADL